MIILNMIQNDVTMAGHMHIIRYTNVSLTINGKLRMMHHVGAVPYVVGSDHVIVMNGPYQK